MKNFTFQEGNSFVVKLDDQKTILNDQSEFGYSSDESSAIEGFNFVKTKKDESSCLRMSK